MAEHNPEKCGCKYLGNDCWTCGHIDNNNLVDESKDTILQSFENLLEYAEQEHNADHHDGFCQDKKADCLTCRWLADAQKNYEILLAEQK